MIILLSSGLDSTVNAYEAATKGKIKLALTFDYGQRAAPREISYSALTCEHLGIAHKVIAIPWLGQITQTALVNTKVKLPLNMDIDNLAQTQGTAKSVWVPNRNGVFLSIAAAFAESLHAKYIIPGFNREEASTFPDNSEAYLNAFTQSLKYSTMAQVEVKCFTTSLDKSQIARRGRELKVNFDYVWPCYGAEEKACGQCESCLRFNRAMEITK